jgi:hypothetical protein
MRHDTVLDDRVFHGKTDIQIFLPLLGHGDGDRNKERIYGTK